MIASEKPAGTAVNGLGHATPQAARRSIPAQVQGQSPSLLFGGDSSIWKMNRDDSQPGTKRVGGVAAIWDQAEGGQAHALNGVHRIESGFSVQGGNVPFPGGHANTASFSGQATSAYPEYSARQQQPHQAHQTFTNQPYQPYLQQTDASSPWRGENGASQRSQPAMYQQQAPLGNGYVGQGSGANGFGAGQGQVGAQQWNHYPA
jgi:hypothetical protein